MALCKLYLIIIIVATDFRFIKNKKQSRVTKSKKKASLKNIHHNQSNNQATLKNFLLKSKENSNGTQTTLIMPKNKNYLEDQIKRKSSVIKTLEQLTAQTRNALINKIRQISDFKRKQNRTVNLLYGHLNTGSKFIYGPYTTALQQQISSLQKTIKTLQLQQKADNTLVISIQSLNDKFQEHQQKLNYLKKQLEARKIQVKIYESRLRLSLAEQSSMLFAQNWPVLNKRYVPHKLLGKGGFAQVYCCYDLERHKEVAIKIHKLDSLDDDSYTNCLKYIRRQIKINKQLKHPNIAEMFEQIQLEGNRIGIVMEYCSGPQLRTYFRQRECLQEKQAKQFIKQILDAIKYLHQRNQKVIHYDLKPANILLHHGKIKIVDFGISKIMNKSDVSIELTSPSIGTCFYLPPEVLLPRKPMINDKVDIWSIGVIFYELLYGVRPYGNKMTIAKFIQNKVIKQYYKFSFPKTHPKGYQISQQVKQFISSCIQSNINKRITAEQACSHPYFKS